MKKSYHKIVLAKEGNPLKFVKRVTSIAGTPVKSGKEEPLDRFKATIAASNKRNKPSMPKV